MTNHSIIRTEERAHKNEKSAKRMIGLAKERGLCAKDFRFRERRYLEEREGQGKYSRYFAGYCFIFNEEFSCITMFAVPKWFGKKNYYQGKQQIRNARQYIRNNPDFFDWTESFSVM